MPSPTTVTLLDSEICQQSGRFQSFEIWHNITLLPQYTVSNPRRQKSSYCCVNPNSHSWNLYNKTITVNIKNTRCYSFRVMCPEFTFIFKHVRPGCFIQHFGDNAVSTFYTFWTAQKSFCYSIARTESYKDLKIRYDTT